MDDPNPPGLPPAALDWARAHAPGRVVLAEPVAGGITSTTWVLTVEGSDMLVLRWTDPATWGAAGREHVRRETMACRLLERTGLPVPAVVADDPEGDVAGGPAALLTWRAGRSRRDPLGDAAVDALARTAVAIHTAPVDDEHRPPAFTPRGPRRPQVPRWARRPELWQHAIEIGRAAATDTAPVLVHQDFHLGNLLWEGDVITGVVDWAGTSWGPPDLDVAHLCSDLALMHGAAAAQRFRSACARVGGRLANDPEAARAWQVRDVLGFLPDPARILPAVAATRPDLSADVLRARLEDHLAATTEVGHTRR